MLKDEPVNPQANPALAKLEGVAEGTFQLLYVCRITGVQGFIKHLHWKPRKGKEKEKEN